MMTPEQIADIATLLSKKIADEGHLVAAGWIGYRMIVMPNAPPAQVEDTRIAFMAGAQHLFHSIISILDPGDNIEPTAADLRKMDLIDKELTAFAREMALRVSSTKGSA